MSHIVKLIRSLPVPGRAIHFKLKELVGGMRRYVSMRSALVVALMVCGTLLLNSCASRRGSQDSVFVRERVVPSEDTARPSENPRFRRSREGEAVRVVVDDESSAERRGRWRFWGRTGKSSAMDDEGGADLAWPSSDDLVVDAVQEMRGGGDLHDLDGAPAIRGYRLRAADQIAVSLRGIPEPADYEFIIPDDGYINLPYISPIQAIGLTVSELQRLVRDRYIEEQIYRQLSVNVFMATQHYFVRGEVRGPGRFPLTSGMTVLQAIAAAGGYTEFANPRRVEIIRAGETISGNARQMEQNPEEDFLVKAGDVIIVRRSIF